MENVRQKLKKELEELEEELHFKLPKEIQKAREFGDLRENAEYKAALERQSIVQARIGQIRQRLSEVQSIDMSKIPTDRVADTGPNGLHGQCVNMPARGMTGWSWQGIEERFVHAPDQYGASTSSTTCRSPRRSSATRP